MDCIREKIALAVCEALPVGLHVSSAHHTSQRAADAILSIPELKEALARSAVTVKVAKAFEAMSDAYKMRRRDPYA